MMRGASNLRDTSAAKWTEATGCLEETIGSRWQAITCLPESPTRNDDKPHGTHVDMDYSGSYRDRQCTFKVLGYLVGFTSGCKPLLDLPYDTERNHADNVDVRLASQPLGERDHGI